ncbi:MAG TPA: metal ABC transporter permease [Polyangia bacterium]|jgi:zinc transport system permease protein
MPETANVGFFAAYELWRDPMVVALLSAGLCGFVGVFIVLKRVVFVSAALSQLSGVGVALFFWLAAVVGLDAHHPPLWANPLWFALAFAVGGSALFSLQLGHRRLSGESAIGLGYLVAASLVLIVLNSPRIAQEAHEVNDLLYGNAVAVAPEQIQIMAAVAAIVFGTHALFHKELVFVSFDPEMARSLGYRTRSWNLLLFVTIGVAISVATRAIGALPVFGFMIIPPAAALLLATRLRSVFVLAVGIALASAGLGYYVSFVFSLPTGATMVVVAALFLVPGLLNLARGAR